MDRGMNLLRFSAISTFFCAGVHCWTISYFDPLTTESFILSLIKSIGNHLEFTSVNDIHSVSRMSNNTCL